ncbi:hypothetical protein BDY24DRAFT_404191 [Mrakia frigida]|uniref:EGFR-like transmembrane domain-containing protein n=1 Tax=Mrakia frigida TaxID=29902 RepID=UPI003FCC1E05
MHPTTNTLLSATTLLLFSTLALGLPVSDASNPTSPRPDSQSDSWSLTSSSPSQNYQNVIAGILGSILFTLLVALLVYLFRRRSCPEPNPTPEVNSGGEGGVMVVELAERREDELGYEVEGEGERRRREGMGRSVIVEVVEKEWKMDAEKEKMDGDVEVERVEVWRRDS